MCDADKYEFVLRQIRNCKSLRGELSINMRFHDDRVTFMASFELWMTLYMYDEGAIKLFRIR